jgi:hypothetical protein
MPKKKQSRKVYGAKTHNWRPEMRPFIVAALCVYNALDFSTKAKEVYNQILEAWGKPGCISLLKGHIVMPVSEFKAWEEAVTTGNSYEPKDIRFKASHDNLVYNEDYINLVLLIAEFIRVGFNHKKDLKGYIEKVTIEKSEYLPLAVQVISAEEYIERHPDLNVEKEIKLGNKVLDPSPFNGVSQERTHRLHTKMLKKYGYSLNHDKKLSDLAWYWYQCRVVYSGIEEFCNKHFKNTGIKLDPANITKEILLADIATGYPRKNLDNSIK